MKLQEASKLLLRIYFVESKRCFSDSLILTCQLMGTGSQPTQRCPVVFSCFIDDGQWAERTSTEVRGLVSD